MGISKTTNSFIKAIDYFGSDIQYTINGDQKAKSILGGLTSIVFYILAALVFAYNLDQFIYHNLPTITQNIMPRDTAREDNISLWALNSSFALFDQSDIGTLRPLNIKIKDFGIYEVSANFIPVPSKDVTEVAYFVPCSELDLTKRKGRLDEFISYVNMSNFLCIYNIPPANATLGGNAFQFTKSHVYNGKVQLDICEEFKNCSNQAYMQNLSSTNNYKLLSIVEATFTNFTEYNGFSTSMNFYYYSFDLTTDYNIKISFTKNTMKTDRNLLFNFFATEEVEYYTSKIDITPKTRFGNSAAITFDLEYYYDIMEIVYMRSYIKIDIMLAAVFSVIQAIWYGLYIFITVFNYGYVENFMASELISVKTDQKRDKINDLRNDLNIRPQKMVIKQKITDCIELYPKKDTLTEENDKIVKNNYVELNNLQIKDIKQKFEGEKVKYNHLLSFFILCKKKRKINFGVIKTIHKMFDVIKIQRNLIELEYMKSILLDKTQLNVLKYFNKKIVTEVDFEEEKKNNEENKEVNEGKIEIHNGNSLNDNMMVLLTSI